MLSDISILTAIDRGRIVIEPFDKSQLGTNSYDVRLGEWYYSPTPDGSILDITHEEEVRRYWGKPSLARHQICVPAGETFLCHTQEVIGARNGFVADMRCRSSLGRSGISVCKCAGIGDVGYIGKWTMEVTNHSAATVVIPVGLRVAQILFHEVGETLKEYEGKYGSWGGDGYDWDAEDMLPKLWLDKDKDRWR